MAARMLPSFINLRNPAGPASIGRPGLGAENVRPPSSEIKLQNCRFGLGIRSGELWIGTTSVPRLVINMSAIPPNPCDLPSDVTSRMTGGRKVLPPSVEDVIARTGYPPPFDCLTEFVPAA